MSLNPSVFFIRQPARRAALCALAAFAALQVAACAGPQKKSGPAVLKIEATPKESNVFVDDVAAGKASEWAAGKSLPAGFHRVELRLPDHHSYFTEVTLVAGTTISIRADLRPRMD